MYFKFHSFDNYLELNNRWQLLYFLTYLSKKVCKLPNGLYKRKCDAVADAWSRALWSKAFLMQESYKLHIKQVKKDYKPFQKKIDCNLQSKSWNKSQKNKLSST